MASIAGYGDLVVISGGNSAFIFNKKLNDLVTLDPPKSEEDIEAEASYGNVPRKGETSMEHANKHMACVALSECGQYLALASSKGKKSLFLWHLKDLAWTFVSQRIMGRAASKIRFTQSSSAVLVADKAGEVCSFSVTDPYQEKEWILGHVTMLLDVLVVDDDKFVITCDRDDKIRVARFPKCYIIHSYCLGHKSFITSLTLLPHNNKFLISTSGDGTVKIWDYVDGKECLSIPVADYMEGAIDDPLPIKQCSALRVSPNSSLICVCIGGLRKCVVFQISGNEELSVKMQHLVEMEDEEIWWSHFSVDKRLYILKNSPSCPVDVLSWTDDFSIWQHEADAANAFKSQAKILQECFASPSIPAMLYRKKFDEPPLKYKRKN